MHYQKIRKRYKYFAILLINEKNIQLNECTIQTTYVNRIVKAYDGESFHGTFSTRSLVQCASRNFAALRAVAFIYGHKHRLCKSYKFTLENPSCNKTRRMLLDQDVRLLVRKVGIYDDCL
jgi:hypothetical protein